MNQSFKLDPASNLGTVTLKVKNLEKLSDFYQALGLSILSQDANQVSLGVEGSENALLKLTKVKDALDRKTAGLFHTAFLLPTRKDLGDTLYRLLVKKIPIGGASDHGYSEALYLDDPEGNGIEIYRDKPKSEWDIREDGRIVGITIEMDADGVLASRNPNDLVEKFPEKTTIGHVHLSVSDIDEAQTFYQKIGFDLTNSLGNQARFFSTGGYHHHIGTNIWLGKNLPAITKEDAGLESFSVLLPSEESLSNLRQNIQEYGITIIEDSSMGLSIIDPNGIHILFRRLS